MSSQPSAPSAPPEGGGEGARLQIRAIEEMPAGHDEELATIFREMRRAAGVSVEQIAARLATSVETVQALESGALLDLPEWTELKRVVTTHAAQLGLDSRPILRRLESQLGQGKAAAAAPAAAPSPPPAVKPEPAPPRPTPSAPVAPTGPPMPPSAKPAPSRPRPSPPPQSPPPSAAASPPSAAATARMRGSETEVPAPAAEREPTGRLARTLRSLVNWAVLLGFVGALGFGVWYAAKRPRLVWSALDNLPEPVPRLMRSAWELVRPLEDNKPNPQISDPENRKSDKLP